MAWESLLWWREYYWWRWMRLDMQDWEMLGVLSGGDVWIQEVKMHTRLKKWCESQLDWIWWVHFLGKSYLYFHNPSHQPIFSCKPSIHQALLTYPNFGPLAHSNPPTLRAFTPPLVSDVCPSPVTLSLTLGALSPLHFDSVLLFKLFLLLSIVPDTFRPLAMLGLHSYCRVGTWRFHLWDPWVSNWLPLAGDAFRKKVWWDFNYHDCESVAH